MKLSEMGAKSEKELIKILGEKKGELFLLKLQLRMGQLAKTASIRSTKRDIARMLTFLTTKNLRGTDATK